MSYLQDRDYNFSQTRRVGWKKPVIIVVFVVGLYLWGSAMFVETSAFIVYPFLRISGKIDQNFSDSLKSKKSLLAENRKLKLDNEKMRVEMLRFNNLQTENNLLRGLKEDTTITPSSILGRIIVKPNHLPYDEIIIDVGQTAVPGLKSGQLVFADKEVVLGQIELVANSYSKIKLFSNGGVKIPVVVGSSAIPSIAEGLGAGNFSLTLPRGVNIKVGDQVKTSIIGSYILGYVANVFKDPNDPFQKIIFRSPYNIFEMEWVRLMNI